MAKLNPYKNNINELIKKFGGNFRFDDYLKKSIKNVELLQNIKNIIEFKQRIAFEEGRKQGSFEASQDLRKLLEVEDPEFLDANQEQ